MAVRRTTAESRKYFTAKVEFNVPNEKGGMDKGDFIGRFAYTETSELPELRELKAEELVRRKLIGWDMTDADTREKIEFTPEELDTFMEITTFANGVGVAFWGAVNGQKK